MDHKCGEWIKVDPLGKIPDCGPNFLLRDEYGHVYTGSTPFDYYDAAYWHRMPFAHVTITNDEWVVAAAKTAKMEDGLSENKNTKGI